MEPRIIDARMIDASPAASLGRRRRLAGLALVVGGLVGVAAVGASRRRSGAVEIRLDAAESAAVAQNVACGTYDDDDTYTPSACSSFDASACSVSCGSGWCAELCGDACARNEGAICAASALANISDLCTTLDYAAVPTATREYETARGHKSMEFAEGCDHHAYCSFCGDTCQNLLTQYPIGAEFISSMNFGPHAMRLLGNLSTICTARLAGPPEARPAP